ncbi:unnamed protein product [Plasmodium vivax]|uniref:(malaria parasite P. vivax) hypothetical protein n=1 Tax=Plasmodium vivax TaxID=5855 RepID=A0A8S4H4U3_PLAVI|nr:unnamed protein product [Plasmodium vivax]
MLIKHDKWKYKNDCQSNLFQIISSESDSLYDENTCETRQQDLLKLKDLTGKEPSTDREISTQVDSDLTRAIVSDGHHIREGNPDSTGDHGLEVDVFIQVDDSSSDKTTKYIINAALPLLGASSFTFLLYKVTPAGTFVNKFFGRNKSAYRNVDNIKQNALSNYNYETEEIDPRIETMNISYNTLSNT